MSAARAGFLRRHEAQVLALSLPDIQGTGLAPTPSNEAARSLRCGLMVQAYASLETFLRERTVEGMSHVAAGSATFSRLPSGLQNMAVFGALDGLRFRAQLWGTSDPRSQPLVQAETEAIASTARSPYGFSTVMFGFDRSNLSPAALKQFLTDVAGLAGDPWYHLTQVSARVGLGGLPLKNGVENGYRARNSSAHDADHQLALQEVEDFLRDSLATALGFDAFLSRAARLLHEGNSVDLGNTRKLTESDIKFRFLDPHKAGWREFREGKQTVKLHRSPVPDMTDCMTRARTNFDVVVQRDAKSWPVSWTTTDCP